MRIIPRTSRLGVRHKAITLAIDAAEKTMVAKNKEKDQIVKLPRREIATSISDNMHMTTMLSRLNTAISGHNSMLRSARMTMLLTQTLKNPKWRINKNRDKSQ